jgi:hypothetical protein
MDSSSDSLSRRGYDQSGFEWDEDYEYTYQCTWEIQLGFGGGYGLRFIRYHKLLHNNQHKHVFNIALRPNLTFIKNVLNPFRLPKLPYELI